MEYNKIYMCRLYRIAKTFKYNDNLSKKDNILKSDKEFIDIMVIKTDDENYVKEILTDRLIPVHLIKKTSDSLGKQIDLVDTLSAPYYVEIEKNYVMHQINCIGKMIEEKNKSTMKEASIYDVKSYASNLNFGECLNIFIEQAEEFYQRAYQENNKKLESNMIATTENIKEIIKEYRKKQI